MALVVAAEEAVQKRLVMRGSVPHLFADGQHQVAGRRLHIRGEDLGGSVSGQNEYR